MNSGMSFPAGLDLIDADSHIMELPDFLIENADPEFRDQMPIIRLDRGHLRDQLGDAISKRQHSPEKVKRAAETGFSEHRDYLAIGAFNGKERAQAIQQMGISMQVVFPSFSLLPAFFGTQTLEFRYACARAANRGLASFAAADERLLPVGVLPLADVGQSLALLNMIIDQGTKLVLIPYYGQDADQLRPAEFDPLWARMEEASIICALHTLGTQQIVQSMLGPKEIVPFEMLDGDAAPRPDRIVDDAQYVTNFLSRMILDGVFLRHPRLRCAVTELGAAWVPGFMDTLDTMAKRLAALSRTPPQRLPSQQIAEQFIFTPYHFEDVGSLMRHSQPHLYAFSTDYPHIEGGRDPVGSFSQSLSGCSDEQISGFFSSNFKRFLDGQPH